MSGTHDGRGSALSQDQASDPETINDTAIIPVGTGNDGIKIVSPETMNDTAIIPVGAGNDGIGIVSAHKNKTTRMALSHKWTSIDMYACNMSNALLACGWVATSRRRGSSGPSRYQTVL